MAGSVGGTSAGPVETTQERIEREVRKEVEARLARAAAVPIHASSVGTAPGQPLQLEELEAQQPSTSDESHGTLQDSIQTSSPVSRAMETPPKLPPGLELTPPGLEGLVEFMATPEEFSLATPESTHDADTSPAKEAPRVRRWNRTPGGRWRSSEG